MASPFGTSNQGGYQGGFGGAQQQSWGGGQGFGGGFQPQQSFGGFGGGGGFGGFGGGGFQPQGFGFGGGYGGGFGNFGGFQPQQQFNPYQGGFGSFGGFGGGYNPMFGGIGGLGFNPMMGPQFGMPMQGFGGFNPDQPEMLSARDPYRANESGMPMPGPTGRHSFDNPRSMDTMYRGGPEMSPEMRQRRAQDMRSAEGMAQQPVDTSVDAFKNSQAYQDARGKAFHGGLYQQDIGKSKYGFTGNSMQTGTLDRAYEDWKKSQPVQPPPQQPNVGVQAPMDGGGMTPSAQDMAQRQAQLQAMYGYSADMARQPMYGGIGGLGFNPMMGPQFGMPMLQGMQANSPQGRAAMGSLGGMNIQPMSAEQQQLLSQLPQQTQASPSGSSFAQLAQMFGGRVPQTSSEPQQPAPPGMKWMLGYGGHSLVPAGMDTSMMG